MSLIGTYIYLIIAVIFGTASNIFAKEAEGKLASAKTNLSPCPIDCNACNNSGLKIGSILINIQDK